VGEGEKKDKPGKHQGKNNIGTAATSDFRILKGMRRNGKKHQLN